MALLKHLQFEKQSFRSKRLVFQGADKAPPSPESFKGPEKQSQQDAINEVAQQSPSQIMSTAMSRATAIKTKYVQNTGILAAIINQPVADTKSSNANSSSNTGGATATNASATTTSTTQNNQKAA